MATRHKDFGKAKSSEEYEPLSFTLEGQEFFCKPAMNGMTLLKFVREADSDDGGRSAAAMIDLFDKVLKKDDAVRFKELVDDPDVLIEMETLGEIVAWVVEQYTSRPTKESSN